MALRHLLATLALPVANTGAAALPPPLPAQEEGLAVDSAAPDKAIPTVARSTKVVTRERLTPSNAVRTMKGRCGAHTYAIELRHNGERNLLSVDVDGRSVPLAEIAKVEQAVSPGYYLYEPSIAECFWDRANARMRLLTDGPGSGGKPVWLSFEVSPGRSISAVRSD